MTAQAQEFASPMENVRIHVMFQDLVELMLFVLQLTTSQYAHVPLAQVEMLMSDASNKSVSATMIVLEKEPV